MIIKPHNGCKETQASKFQDEKYGKGFRVATEFKKGTEDFVRCTVCSSTLLKKGNVK